MKQYDPTLMRARSRFEGVSTPRNEWNMHLQKLRSNKHQGRVHPNVTEVYVPIIDMMLGKDGPRHKKSGKPTTVSRTDTITKVANKEGVVY